MSLWHSVLARSPLLKIMRNRSRGLGRVLMYHRVVLDDCDPITRRLLVGAITRSAFERQLDYLVRHYQVVSLREIVERREQAAGLVALTFDDGYADNLWNALPALRARGLSATVFVTSGYLDATEGVWWERLARWVVRNSGQTIRFDTGSGIQEYPSTGRCDQQFRVIRKWLADLPEERRKSLLVDMPTDPRDRFLTVEELRELAAGGMGVEGHTVTHPRLSSLGPEAALREVSASKAALEAILDQPVQFMAYPFGEREDFDATSMEVARAAGYRAAFAAYRGLLGSDTDPFAIPRIGIRQEFDRFRVTTARAYPSG
jgi:peptidoglycan/xylan/chitin deacetylase (PgdA/CDA1 family)